MAILERTLDRRGFVAAASAAGFAALAGWNGLHAEVQQGKLTLVSLPNPLANGSLIWDVSALGYEVQEYLVSSAGTTFAPISATDAGKRERPDTSLDWGVRDREYAANRPADFSARPQTGTGAYTTRIIVYRPREMKKFSGNVIFEAVHPRGGNIEVWSMLNRFFLQRGDAVVHLDQPGQFSELKKTAAERYGPLSMENRTLFWTSISQIATLVKSGGAGSPLPAPGRHLYFTGYSGSADYVYTFLSYHHRLTRMPDGKPVFDGYLPMSHIRPVPPIDAVILSVATQSDIFGASSGSSPESRAFRGKYDSDAAVARRRRYELPGLFHTPLPPPEPGMAVQMHPPSETDLFASCVVSQKWPAGAEPNPFPKRAMLEACFHHASRWVKDGVAPPHAPLIETGGNETILTDENGNARGGLRFPDVSVPAETFIPGVRGGAVNCGSTGYRLPFSREKMTSLYGNRAHYLSLYDAAANKMVKDGFILLEGAAQMKANRRTLTREF